MSRLVQPFQIDNGAGGRGQGQAEAVATAQPGAPPGDNYVDRLAKYIPGEIIAAYMALDRNLVSNAAELGRAKKDGRFTEALTRMAEQDPLASYMPHLPGAILALGLFATPLYFWQLSRQGGGRSPWVTHACMATAAFLVWAYAIQGSYFVVENVYNGKIASALVIVFTLFSGIFVPVAGKADAAEAGVGAAELGLAKERARAVSNL